MSNHVTLSFVKVNAQTVRPQVAPKKYKAHYKIHSENGGLEIERVADGATCFMQGDEAQNFETEIEACKTQQQIDLLCSAYDEVMKGGK